MREIGEKRAVLIGQELETFARRFGVQLHFDHNRETGRLRVFAIRPDNAKQAFQIGRRYTAKTISAVKSFIVPN